MGDDGLRSHAVHFIVQAAQYQPVQRQNAHTVLVATATQPPFLPSAQGPAMLMKTASQSLTEQL